VLFVLWVVVRLRELDVAADAANILGRSRARAVDAGWILPLLLPLQQRLVSTLSCQSSPAPFSCQKLSLGGGL
jgi:hypothetical protein